MKKGATNISDIEPTAVGKCYLLLIAIDEYHDRHFSPLNNCKKDAARIRELLTSKYHFKEENIIELTDSQATNKNILDAFARLRSQVKEWDNVVFLFSGHGEYLPEIERGYWVTYRSEKADRSTYLNNIEVRDWIKSLPARHVFGMVDSCFSGALFRGTRPHEVPVRRHLLSSRWLLTAGRLEPVEDGALGRHSPFAQAIAEQLENHSGEPVWVSDLCNAVKRVLENNARQLPRGEPLADAGHQGGEFAFIPAGASLPAPGEDIPSPYVGGSGAPAQARLWQWLLGTGALAILSLLFWVWWNNRASTIAALLDRSAFAMKKVTSTK